MFLSNLKVPIFSFETSFDTDAVVLSSRCPRHMLGLSSRDLNHLMNGLWSWDILGCFKHKPSSSFWDDSWIARSKYPSLISSWSLLAGAIQVWNDEMRVLQIPRSKQLMFAASRTWGGDRKLMMCFWLTFKLLREGDFYGGNSLRHCPVSYLVSANVF